jgi:ABC-type multidrug transport system ATPase subunit
VALIKQEHARLGLTLVLTTHEVEELAGLIDTLYVIDEHGQLAARGNPNEVFAMHELLVAANVRPPQLVQLATALAARGIALPASQDPEIIADALAALLHERQCAGDRLPVAPQLD